MTRMQRDAGAAELREIAGGRSDLLAEAAGLALGTSQRRGGEYQAQAQAIAELCQLAGAGESMTPAWTEEGRRRPAERRKPPFSRPGRTPRRP